jgi:hypothetical protein
MEIPAQHCLFKTLNWVLISGTPYSLAVTLCNALGEFHFPLFPHNLSRMGEIFEERALVFLAGSSLFQTLNVWIGQILLDDMPFIYT